MLKRIEKILFLIVLCLFLSILQFSLPNTLAGAGKYINPGLITLIFIIFFFGLKSAFYFIFIFGVSLDLLSFQFFGFYTISLVAATLAATFVLHNWLTNKSLYSFWALILISVVVYNFFLAGLDFVASGLSGGLALGRTVFWQTIIFESGWALLAASLLFNLFIFWLKKFKPFFLENKQVM
jgi:hypothetical protein